MPNTQPELILSDAQKPGPDPDLVARVQSFLRGRGWTTAKQLAEASPELLDLLGGPNGYARSLRAIAEASEGWILSSSKGYLHARDATAEDFRLAASRLTAQALKMARRAGKIRARAHALLSGS